MLIEHCLQEYCSVSSKEMIYCKNVATNLLTNIPVEEFNLQHAEADTAIFTIYYNVRENDWQGPVFIDAGDTDISHQIERNCCSEENKYFYIVIQC